MTEYLEITGGFPLSGTIKVGGAKNATLPLLLASLLTSERCEFENVPNLYDVSLITRILEHFGGEVHRSVSKFSVFTPIIASTEASYSLVKALRASFWILGPLLARAGSARVALPGGDIIGARPVDMHLAALTEMGADISVKHGTVIASAPHGLKPAKIELRFPSVGATHQVVMAASLTPGTTIIEGAAKEPEVVALAEMINLMGGEIIGAGTPTIVISGKKELGGANVTLIGDRIEAATYILAAAATSGSVRVDGISPGYFGKFLDIIYEMGIDLEVGTDFVFINSKNRLKPVNVATGPFPEFATDLQALLMAALCVAEGESTIEENIFEGRFRHISELCRMGADIKVNDRTAIITGVKRLSGAEVEGFDIRAAASLVIASLAAEGKSKVHEPQHLRRGYENLEEKLALLGGKILCKMADPEDYIFSGC